MARGIGFGLSCAQRFAPRLRYVERLFSQLQSRSPKVGSKYREDIPAYARDVLGVRLTDQQEHIASRLPIEKKVLVPSGNEVGKCPEVHTLIRLTSGECVEAGKLIDRRFKVLSYDFDAEQLAPHNAFAEDNGLKPCVRVTTESGFQLTVTENHPLYAASIWSVPSKTPKIDPLGWTPTSALKPGDLVACPIETPCFGDKPLDERHLKLLAYMIGDGGMTNKTPGFTQMPGAQMTEFLQLTESIGCRNSVRPATKGKAFQIGVSGTIRPFNPLTTLLRDHGLMGKHSRDKFIPTAVFTAPREQVALFLNRLYSTDGWASVQKYTKRLAPQIGFCSISERMIREIQELLVRFGIRSRIRFRRKVNAWCVEIISAENIEKFAEQIGILGKETAVAHCLEVAKNIKKRDLWRTRELPPGLYWQRVEKVESIGEQPTVAICVPGPENYCSQVLEHNSYLAAVLALHHYDCFDPGFTFVTAPAFDQITDCVFKEMRTLRPRDKDWQPKANRLQSRANHVARGITAKDATAFQGRHEGHVCIIFDEAEGMEEEFWEATATMADWHVCFYNPTQTTSPVARREREKLTEEGKPLWYVHRLSAFDHPNIKAALANEPIPFPNAVTLEKIKYRLNLWATKVEGDEPTHPDDVILDGQRWRLGPVAQARLAGIRPSGATNSVFSEGLWQKVLANRHEIQDHWPLQLGADIARYGDDHTVIVVRRGLCILHIERHNGWNTVATAERIKQLVHKYSHPHEVIERIPCIIDDTGVGGGVVDQGGDYRFVGVNWGWKAADETKYGDVRSELWFDAVEAADQGLLDISRLTYDMQNALRDQLLAPCYWLDKKGRRIVEEKSATKLRLTESPDIADAFILSLTPHTSYYEKTASIR